MSEESSLPKLRDRALGIVATGTILAILYFGREVLVPITLAVILSLLISPLVRVLRRLGLGPTSSVLAAVLVLTMALGAVASVIGVQVAHMLKSLPQYERTTVDKLYKVNELTVDRLAAFTSQTERLVGERREPRAASGAPTSPLTPGTPADAPVTPADGSPDTAEQAAPVPAPLSAARPRRCPRGRTRPAHPFRWKCINRR